MRASVLIADDHPVLAEGLRRLLAPDYEVLGSAKDGRELLELATRLPADVIVCDLSMPFLNGFDTLRALRRAGVRSKLIVLTMHKDVSLAVEAFRAGAAAFVLKQGSPEELITAIDWALRGRSYVSPALPTDLINLLAEAARRPAKEGPKLTSRQREVVQLVAEGKTMKEVAAILSISPRTAESYKYEIMRTFGIHSNAELIQYAIRIGLVTVPPLDSEV